MQRENKKGQSRFALLGDYCGAMSKAPFQHSYCLEAKDLKAVSHADCSVNRGCVVKRAVQAAKVLFVSDVIQIRFNA
mgnify:FL=1